MSTLESSAPAQRPNVGLKWTLGILGVFILLALGGAIFFYLRDAPAPNDTDFQNSARTVPANEDGIAQLQTLANYFDFGPFALHRGLSRPQITAMLDEGTLVDDAVVDDFIKTVGPDYAELDRVLSLPYFGSNSTHSLYDITLEAEVIQRARRVTKLVSTRRQRMGDYAGAVTDVLRGRHLAEHFTEDQVPKVDVMHAILADANADRGAVDLLNDRSTPPAELARLQAGWGTARWNQALQLSLNGEYQFFLKVLWAVSSEPMLNSSRLQHRPVESYWTQFTLQKSASRNELAAYFRMLRATLAKNYANIDEAAIRTPAFAARGSSTANSYLAPNYGGRLILQNETRGRLDDIQLAFTATADDRLIETALALRRYFDGYHTLPAKLEDLTPDYLPRVPIDPFSGKPLRYDAARGLIYSVGTLLRDDGGSKRPARSTYSVDNDPLNDPAQPTLQLTLQNPPASKTP